MPTVLIWSNCEKEKNINYIFCPSVFNQDDHDNYLRFWWWWPGEREDVTRCIMASKTGSLIIILMIWSWWSWWYIIYDLIFIWWSWWPGVREDVTRCIMAAYTGSRLIVRLWWLSVSPWRWWQWPQDQKFIRGVVKWLKILISKSQKKSKKQRANSKPSGLKTWRCPKDGNFWLQNHFLMANLS